MVKLELGISKDRSIKGLDMGVILLLCVKAHIYFNVVKAVPTHYFNDNNSRGVFQDTFLFSNLVTFLKHLILSDG